MKLEKNDIQYNEIIKSQLVMQLMNSSQLKAISIPNETVHRMIQSGRETETSIMEQCGEAG